MPHIFFPSSEDDLTARPPPSDHLLGAGQNGWGKTWNKVGGWLKKEDEENEPPMVTEEHETLDETMEEKEQDPAISPPRPLQATMPYLPRPATFQRQNSELREKLCPHEPDPEERRALSADRRAGTVYLRKPTPPSAPHPLSSSPTSHSRERAEGGQDARKETSQQPPSSEARQNGQEEHGDIQLEQRTSMSHHEMVREQDHFSEALDDLQIQAELEAKWILNLSMHFRDNSDREKFFITYAETPNKWRRVTISCDYRDMPADSLEADLKSLHYQRDKSARIYESIRDSLPDIQFYPAVTNLKLQTDDGRLHVHVTEDVNEKIPYPPISILQHLDCPRFKESAIEFDSHLSGFVYKIKTGGRVYIKKEIPGPEAVDEFLYEVNALSSLREAANVVQFEGIVVDDDEQLIKGLLIGFCERGALVDVIYDYKNSEWLPWSRRQRWAKQIVNGLSDIHEAGFVQGDFTLSNIVIDRDDTARIIDINRRGCPVGWEPPELSKLIRSGQRISIHIGVKSDLFQLGMVLWALAEQEDEPERQEAPLRLGESSEIPKYYREAVESCLNPDPRLRLSAKDIFAKFASVENSHPHDEGEPRICLSPHRSEKEYIDPATAVGLEDIDQLKSIARNGHHSQFSMSEATFADCATSSEYYFLSCGSGLVGSRGRSHAASSDWAKRHGVVSIDLDEADDLEAMQEIHIADLEYNPHLVDLQTECSNVAEKDGDQPVNNQMDLSFHSNATATPVNDAEYGSQRKVSSPDLTLTLPQDFNTGIRSTGPVETAPEQRFSEDRPVRTPGPPIHQDSGFDELLNFDSPILPAPTVKNSILDRISTLETESSALATTITTPPASEEPVMEFGSNGVPSTYSGPLAESTHHSHEPAADSGAG
jgi:serine/threonine protein kinase